MKRFLISLALVLAFVSIPVLREWPVVRLLAAADVNHTFGAGVDSWTTSNTNYTVPSVTAGNSIIVAMACGTGSTTFGANDATNGAYSSGVTNIGGIAGTSAAVYYFHNSAGGVTTVRVTSSTTCNGVVFIYEVSGLANAVPAFTGTTNNTTGTNHTCSSSGLTQTNGFSVCAAMMGAGVAQTQGSGWTKATTPNNARFSQYRFTSISSDTGPFTSTSDSGSAVMAVFADVAASTTNRGLLMGIFP